MTLENPQNKKKEKLSLKVMRGGKFDEASFLRRAEKILPKVQNTNDVGWLFSVYNRYEELLDDEDLKAEEIEIAENIAAEAAGRLTELGYSVEDQLEDKEMMIKREKFNV